MEAQNRFVFAHPLGLSQPFVGEVTRVRVPRSFPWDILSLGALLTSAKVPEVKLTTNDEGISIRRALVSPPHQLAEVPLSAPFALPRQFWLHISWPGYELYQHTDYVKHDGTLVSIVKEIARLYFRFLHDARGWVCNDKGPYMAKWRIVNDPIAGIFSVDSLRLVSLTWLGEDVFQANVDFVEDLPWFPPNFTF